MKLSLMVFHNWYDGTTDCSLGKIALGAGFKLLRTFGLVRKLSNASPFLIFKAVHGSAGSVKSIKKLPSGDLLIETTTQAQSISLVQCTNVSNIPITATPHKTLNSSKGVIYCPDLIQLPDSEIEEELASQGVESVKRITSVKDGKTITSPLFILAFFKHTFPENILIGYLNIKVRPYIPNPLGCFRCQSYGHRTASCRGVATCNKCCSTEHASEACTTKRRSVQTERGDTLLIPKSVQNGSKKKKYKELKYLKTFRILKQRNGWSISYHLEPPFLMLMQ
ncbi:uncharacterized protein TNCV_1544291 [Trichonephila clavipes]|nr:uncharacterized protein TNCV_1544291 [Trichonephila clavipes]